MLLPNVVAAGIYDSNIVAKNVSISKNRKTTMFEIELPIEEGGISYIGNDSSPIAKNMIISAKPDQIRHSKFPFKCYFIHMTIPDEHLKNTLLQTENFITITHRETYEEIFTTLIRHYEFLSPTEEIFVQSLLLKLIYCVINDSSTTSCNNNIKDQNSIIKKTITYIHEHLTEDLSLKTVAEAMSLSPVYFHNVFKSATGKTLHDYIEEQRIKKAIYLLQTTNYSLTKVAYECGFSSQSYFSFVFKRRMKNTPRKYLKDIYCKYEL